MISKKYIIWIFLSILPFYSSTQPNIKKTRLEAEIEVMDISYSEMHPSHIDLLADLETEQLWNSTNQKHPALLQILLPEGTSFINHQLPHTIHPTSVRLDGAKAAIVRATYQFKGQTLVTNVIFNHNALIKNIDNLETNLKNKWLVRTDAKAAILFLHGGGTRTTGGATAEPFINHFSPLGIDIIAPDLPMHAGGPRQFLGIEKDILALGAFAQKYIPPHIPLFVYGHSWGAVFADELMRMTFKNDTSNFHPNLKGIFIASPAMDPAPNQSIQEKTQEYIKRKLKGEELAKTKAPPAEKKIWEDIIQKGKISLLGSLYSSITLHQRNQTIPKHKGKEWIDTVLITGTGDPLVYLGFEDLFHKYYDKLLNVKTYYLDQLPYIFGKEETKVGHMLTDWAYSSDNTNPVDFEIIKQTIAQILNIKLDSKSADNITAASKYRPFASIVHLYSNNLAFRVWLNNFTTQIDHSLEKEIGSLQKRQIDSFNRLKQAINNNTPPYQFFNLLKETALNNKETTSLKTQLSSLKESFDKWTSNKEQEWFNQLLESQTPQSMARTILLNKKWHHIPIIDTIRNDVTTIFNSAHFDKSIQFYLTNTSTQTKVENLYNTFKKFKEQKNYTTDKHIEKAIIKNAVQIISHYHPQHILYQILIHLSEKEYHHSLEYYLLLLKEYDGYFLSLSEKYQNIALHIEELLKSKTLTELKEKSLNIIKKFPKDTFIDRNSFKLQKFLHTYKNQQSLNKKELHHDLEQFILPQEIKTQIIDLLEQIKNNPSINIIPNIRNLIIDHTALNKHFELIKLLKQINFRDTLVSLHSYFSKDPDFKKQNLNKLNKLISLDKDVQQTAFEMLADMFFQPTSENQKIVREMIKNVNDQLFFTSQLEGYFSPSAIKKIQPSYTKYFTIHQYFHFLHIPTIEDFYKYYKEKKSPEKDKHYLELIQKIKHHTEKIDELNNQFAILTNRKQSLVTQINESNLLHYIRLVKQAFDTALSHPPDVLKEDYKKLEKLHKNMLKAYHELINTLEISIQSFLKQGNDMPAHFVIKTLKDENINSLTEKALKAHSIWKEKYWQINNSLVPIAGELGQQYKEAFDVLYGEKATNLQPKYYESKYIFAKNTMVSIAETESQLLQIKEQLAQIQTQYSQIYPAETNIVLNGIDTYKMFFDTPIQSSSQTYIKEIIEYINANTHHFNILLKIWNNMAGRVLMPLPSDSCRIYFD